MFSFHLFIGLNKQTVVFFTTCEISGVGGGLNSDEDVIMRARARARLCVGAVSYTHLTLPTSSYV